MALFNRNDAGPEDEILASDVATRALSVTAVETDFVAGVYEKLASVYDYTFGPTLHAGRLQALQRMAIAGDDRILEVGVGTGINLTLYPRDCTVTGVDLSDSMLEKAYEKIAKNGLRNVRLQQMDASALNFADDSFDIVYAPYLISVVADPVKVAQEMHRVCRPGGRVIILNHFLSTNRFIAMLEKWANPLCEKIGWRSDLALADLVAKTQIEIDYRYKLRSVDLWETVVTTNTKSALALA